MAVKHRVSIFTDGSLREPIRLSPGRPQPEKTKPDYPRVGGYAALIVDATFSSMREVERRKKIRRRPQALNSVSGTLGYGCERTNHLLRNSLDGDKAPDLKSISSTYMELIAIHEGLLKVKSMYENEIGGDDKVKVSLYTDSHAAIGLIRSADVTNVGARGCKRIAINIAEVINKMKGGFQTEMMIVPGHSGHPENGHVHDVAKKACVGEYLRIAHLIDRGASVIMEKKLHQQSSRISARAIAADATDAARKRREKDFRPKDHRYERQIDMMDSDDFRSADLSCAMRMISEEDLSRSGSMSMMD